MPDDLLLPVGSRLLHVGPQKTGTTAIQVAMAEARDAMAQHGAWYPSGDHRRRKAGWALGLPGGPAHTPMRHWDELVAEVRAADADRICVSDENFARADADVVDKIVTDLGGEDPHVVAVARRLDRYLPSQWQERVRAGSVTDSFEDWLRDVFDETSTSRERRNVWMGHDTEALARRWADRVGADHVTVVVADEGRPTQQLELFESMLGLPAGTLELHPDRSNQGFGLTETELVRKLRATFRRNGWPAEEYRALVRYGVQRHIRNRGDRAPGPRHAPLPAWADERVRELSDRRATVLPTLGVRVIGDPDELRVPAGDRPDPVDLDTLALPVDLVVEAVEAVVRQQHERAAVPSPEDLGGRDLLRLLARRFRRRSRPS